MAGGGNMEQSGGKKRSSSKSLARSLFTSPMGRTVSNQTGTKAFDFASVAKNPRNRSSTQRPLLEGTPATPTTSMTPATPSAAVTYQETIRDLLREGQESGMPGPKVVGRGF